jgi:hypothetical protein
MTAAETRPSNLLWATFLTLATAVVAAAITPLLATAATIVA